MDPVTVTISHSLGKDEVVRRLQPALGQAAKTFPILQIEDETWTGDRLDFRVRALGQVVSGNLVVGEADVRLELRLPWLLGRFADTVRRTIESRGRILLGNA